MSRKQFLLAGAAITLTGCAGIPPQLLPGRRKLEPDAGPFASPASDSVDLISHVLGRLSFGPRAGDYGRVSGLAAMPEESIQKYIAEQLDAEHIDDSALDHAIRRIEIPFRTSGRTVRIQRKSPARRHDARRDPARRLVQTPTLRE